MDYKITTDAYKVADWLERERLAAPIRVQAIVQRNANKMLTRIRALSPYRTGEYRASHSVLFMKTGSMEFGAEIGSDLARGRPLEFGGPVKGRDGVVRQFEPRPHFRPAFDEIAPVFEKELMEFIIQ